MTTTTLEQTRAADPAHFEAIYADALAGGETARIPWEEGQPCPALVAWLNAIAPSLVRCGARVAVVGCGLGHDAREVMRRGYEVTAFDCSGSAVEWARRLDPENELCYLQADLFSPPPRWTHRFDLVVEVKTLQSLPPDQRVEALKQLHQLMSPHGHLLIIARAAEQPAAVDDGPPWPMTLDELREAATLAGLEFDGEPAVFNDNDDPTKLRLRALLRHASS